LKTPNTIKRQRLSNAWEQRVTRTATFISIATFALLAGFAALLLDGRVSAGVWLPVSAVAALLTYLGMTRKIRRRQQILTEPFPTEWEAILQREVLFFRALNADEQMRFRRELQVFIGEKQITGIRFKMDATTRVLTAASAIIPIFGFPEWEWDQINEVLVYPDRFDGEYDFEDADRRQTLGMVGTGALNRLMILSQPDLVAGFRNAGDKRNVGVHEFAHLVDKSDGKLDGLPGVGLDQSAIGPWIALVRRKMDEMERGDSDINPYGLTNEAEFFAVASEYFFERPGIMERKHPELYAMLSRVFNQDFTARAETIARERLRGRPRFGRNSPCPCGSGSKYKKCCLNAAQAA